MIPHCVERIGECKRCGSCCVVAYSADAEMLRMWPNMNTSGPCPQLVVKDGQASCACWDNGATEVCKRYPRVPEDLLTKKCGFKFVVDGAFADFYERFKL